MQRLRLSQPCRLLARVSSSGSAAATRPRYVAMGVERIDGHLHVWASKEDGQSGKFPFAGALIGSAADASEPPLPGHVEVLLEDMEKAGVSGAFIIQPGNHLYDHSYVASVLRAHPNKFAAALLANPTTNCQSTPRPAPDHPLLGAKVKGQDGGADELERLVKEEGFSAVRFNPYLWPEGEKMTNARGRKMYQRAGALGVPVGHMPFKGLLRHIDEIEALLREYPETKAIIDHMGFCKASDPDSEEWRRLLALAAFPQVYVKASAFFRVSAESYPYLDIRPCVKRLVSAFGAERVMWGSDFPWVTEKCSYPEAWGLLDAGDSAAGAALLTPEEREAVFGKTLKSLFPSAFGQGKQLWAAVPPGSV